jgi:hypothetical protein
VYCLLKEITENWEVRMRWVLWWQKKFDSRQQLTLVLCFGKNSENLGVFYNFRALKLGGPIVSPSGFPNKEAETQRVEMTCPKLHRLLDSRPRPDPSPLPPRLLFICYFSAILCTVDPLHNLGLIHLYISESLFLYFKNGIILPGLLTRIKWYKHVKALLSPLKHDVSS